MVRLFKSVTSLFFCMLTISTFGQSFTMSHDSVVVNDLSSTIDVVCHNWIHNTSANQVNYTWRRVVNNIPTGWQSAICDPVQCYASFVNTESFTLAAGDSGILDGHFYVGGISGFGEMIVKIFETSDSAGTCETVVYQAQIDPDTTNTGSAVYPNEEVSVNVFPNPAQNFIFVEVALNTGTTAISLFDMLGNKVKHHFLQTGSYVQIDVSGLPAGNYFLRAGNSRNFVIRKILLNK